VTSGLQAFWRSVPWPQKAATLMLCAAVLAGHVAHRDRQLFPFVRWGMYDTRYEPEVMVAFEMYGITQEGARRHINIGRTVPSIRRGAPMKFTQAAGRLESNGTAEDSLVVREVISAVASLYGELNGITVTRVEVVKEVIHRDAPGAYRRSTEVVASFPVRRAARRSSDRRPSSP
jgi:hypothetical protein